MGWPGIGGRRGALEFGVEFEADTDARPVDRHPRQIARDPDAARRRSLRRRAIVLALCALFVGGAIAALFGRGGLAELSRLRRETAAMRAQVETRRQKVADLRIEVERLQRDSGARERIAREELGLVQPGELDFLLPPEPPGEP